MSETTVPITQMLAKTGPNGIPARIGDTPGRETVTLFDFDGKTTSEIGSATACNRMSKPIHPDTWVTVAPDGSDHIVTARLS